MDRTVTSVDFLEVVAMIRRMAADGTARELRIRNLVSLREIAAVTDSTPGAVWKWETGLRTPRHDAAVRYAEVLTRLHELDEVGT